MSAIPGSIHPPPPHPRLFPQRREWRRGRRRSSEPAGSGDCFLTRLGRPTSQLWDPRPLEPKSRPGVPLFPARRLLRSVEKTACGGWGEVSSSSSSSSSSCVHIVTLPHTGYFHYQRRGTLSFTCLLFRRGKMPETWLVNSRVIAKKVKNATIFPSCPVKDWVTEAMRQCPNCKHRIDNSDVSLEWPGLPAGVKFDPSDVELVEHLAGKVGHGNSKPHVFIDEFIPTLEGDEGICYTHPENLPGVKKDGSSAHFFHRTFNAYATGHRKRRKILCDHNLSQEDVRWHKTGKTRPVVENGIQKGFKKIMVLYKSSKKGLKPVKTNWVMHQYHLGTEEDEQEREFVVSKVFLQSQAKGEKIDVDPADVDAGTLAAGVSPVTPKTHTPYPPRVGKNCRYDEGDDDNLELLFKQGKNIESQFHSSHTNVRNSSAVWAGESQAVEDPDPNNLVVSLMCDEVLDPLFPVEGSKPKHPQCSWKDFGRNEALGKDNMLCGFPDLDSIDTDTPPDFNLADLQFGSQDSLISWLDWL